MYSDQQKLRKLLTRIKADFLGNQKAAIEIELSKTPITMTYDIALTASRNAVNTKFPSNNIATKSNTRRHIRQTNQKKKREDEDRLPANYKRRRNDSELIKLPAKNGKPAMTIEYHPSFRFPLHILQRFTPELRTRLERERNEYRQRNGASQGRQQGELATIVSQQQAQIQELQSSILNSAASLPPPLPPIPTQVQLPPGNASVASVVTNPMTTVMGGRNEQAQIRQQRSNQSHIGMLKSVVRRVNQSEILYPKIEESPDGTVADNESDTNADTIVAGQNFINIGNTSRVADVYGFTKELGKCDNIPIASAATAWTDPATKMTYILVFHETLFYGSKLDHSLINPNNLRDFGVGYWDNPYDQERPLSIEVPDGISIPLSTKGTKIFFSTFKPSRIQLDTCPHIQMNSAEPWNPQEVIMGQVISENGLPFSISTLGTDNVRSKRYLDPVTDEALIDSSGFGYWHQDVVIKRQACEVIQYGQETQMPRITISTDRHQKVTEHLLAERFGIGIDRARATLRSTTQKGIRSAIMPLS